MLEGMDKVNSYDKFWLERDMENMGHMFEYCSKYSREQYNISNFNKTKFINDFMRSPIRREMEMGQPRLVSQAAYDTFILYIDVDLNGDIERYNLGHRKPQNFRHNELYWVGWVYAYVHYEADMRSKDVIERLPLDFMLQQYHLGHEMDLSVFYDKIKAALN